MTIRVLTPPKIFTRKCKNCEAELEYSIEDLLVKQRQTNLNKKPVRYFVCPCCKRDVYHIDYQTIQGPVPR